MPASWIDSGGLGGPHLRRDAEGVEDVRRARARGDGAVAVLGDARPRARRDEGRGGRNVEGSRGVAAGAAGIDRREAVRQGHAYRPVVEGRGESRHLLDVGPLTVRLARKAPTWACETEPSAIWSMKLRASARVELLPGGEAFQQVLDGGHFADAREEVPDEALAVLGADGFGMELESLDPVLDVADGHDLAVRGGRADLEADRQAFALDGEGMVADGAKGIRRLGEEGLAVVRDGVGLAVHDPLRADYPRPEGGGYRLMPETDAEYGLLPREASD